MFFKHSMPHFEYKLTKLRRQAASMFKNKCKILKCSKTKCIGPKLFGAIAYPTCVSSKLCEFIPLSCQCNDHSAQFIMPSCRALYAMLRLWVSLLPIGDIIHDHFQTIFGMPCDPCQIFQNILLKAPLTVTSALATEFNWHFRSFIGHVIERAVHIMTYGQYYENK